MATTRDAGARGARGSLGFGLAGAGVRGRLYRPLYLAEALASISLYGRRLTCARTRSVQDYTLRRLH